MFFSLLCSECYSLLDNVKRGRKCSSQNHHILCERGDNLVSQHMHSCLLKGRLSNGNIWEKKEKWEWV